MGQGTLRGLTILISCAIIAACGDDGAAPKDAGGDALVLEITAFTATPSLVEPDVATMVTWDYAVSPTSTIPECTIDNGVGIVAPGQMTSVTLVQDTTFTLSCTSDGSTAQRQTIITLPRREPVLATFTANGVSGAPAAKILANQAQNVTFAWTYTGIPSPPPTCTIDGDVGTTTSGAAVSVNLPTSRIYRLRCSNGVGAAAEMDVTVNVDECASGTHDCPATSTCTDTDESFTCACNEGFVGDGDVCRTGFDSCPGAFCDDNASCYFPGGMFVACKCDPGYVGTGEQGACQRLHRAFVTSTAGTGDFSATTAAWGGTGVGLARADSICQAASANLPSPSGTYVAWMSDQNNDAYCRVHGLSGKKSNKCNQANLPVDAGPWVRYDNEPFAPAIDRMLAPTRAIYRPASLTEFGDEVGTSDKVWSGTSDSGEYAGNACTNWSTASSLVMGAMGEAHGGAATWTDANTVDPACSSQGHLLCLQISGGPPLPTRHPTNVKRVFLTSVDGTGNLGAWPDAVGASAGNLAGDAICQSRARYAGYQAYASFKAMLSGSTTSFNDRFTGTGLAGGWVRPDGIPVFTSKTTLFTSFQHLLSAISQTETKAYVPGTVEAGATWTGMTPTGGSATNTCANWSDATTGQGQSGRHDLLDLRYTQAAPTAACSMTQRLMCVQD